MHDEQMGSVGIAELAQRAGVTPRTIRYYVAEGLLPTPSGRGQRRAYGHEHLQRLAAIRELKAAFLPLHEIRRRLANGSVSPPPRTGQEAPRASARTDGAAPPTVPNAPVAVGALTNRAPMGFGGAQGVGRIEIFDPEETIWRRHVLAQGVELHVRETDDPRLAQAIQRLIREAAAILDGRQAAERSCASSS